MAPAKRIKVEDGDDSEPDTKKIKKENLSQTEATGSVAALDPSAKPVAKKPTTSQKLKLLAKQKHGHHPPKALEVHKDIDSDIEALTKYTRALGRKIDLQESLDGWTLQGIIPTLYHHQAISIGWMAGMEKNSTTKKDQSQHVSNGGILADSMGMGKTLSVLGVIVANPSKATTRKNGKMVTLVVATKSAVPQWKDEVKLHTTSLKVKHFNKNEDEEWLWEADVLLIGYAELQSLWKKGSHPLFEFTFHRIVLDEAHEIRNADTQTYQACLALKGTLKWCLSATPTPNGIGELYSPLKFLDVKWARGFVSSKALKQKFSVDTKTATSNSTISRLKDLLEPIMMKRSQDAILLGQPIITPPLPQVTETDVDVNLYPEESALYKYVFLLPSSCPS